jgi:hypothetical protein
MASKQNSCPWLPFASGEAKHKTTAKKSLHKLCDINCGESISKKSKIQ